MAEKPPMPIPHIRSHAELKIEVRTAGGAELEIALAGSISHDTSPGLLEELLELRRKAGVASLTLDFTRVDFVDSQGIGVVCNLHQELEKRGGRLRIVGAADSVRRVLRIMRLDQIFEVA